MKNSYSNRQELESICMKLIEISNGTAIAEESRKRAGPNREIKTSYHIGGVRTVFILPQPE